MNKEILGTIQPYYPETDRIWPGFVDKLPSYTELSVIIMHMVDDLRSQ